MLYFLNSKLYKQFIIYKFQLQSHTRDVILINSIFKIKVYKKMSFSATTYNAIQIKVLVETSFQNVGELNLFIDKDGIKSFPLSSHSTEFYVNLSAYSMNIHLLFHL